MQTFHTRISALTSAVDLDDARLGKQRVEVQQILGAIADPDKGYQNHPAVNMWRGYEMALCAYGAQMAYEWSQRGKLDRMTVWFAEYEKDLRKQALRYHEPAWWRDRDMMRSHRSNLLRKNNFWYGSLWDGNLSDDWPYLWPEFDTHAELGYILRVSRADVPRIIDGERNMPAHLEFDPETREVFPA